MLDERHRLFQHMQPKRQYNVGTQTVFQCFPMFSNVFNTKLGHRLCPNVFKTNNLYFLPQLMLQAEKLVNENTSYLKYFWWCNVSINFHIFCNWGFFCDTNNTKSEYTSFWRSYGSNFSLIYIFWLTISLYSVNFFLTSETRNKGYG